MIYVYGVVAAGASFSPPAKGVAGAETTTVSADGLAAVVSPVPGERLRVRRSDLRAHLDVLESVFAETTVLPASFGTVLPSEDDVRDHLLEGRRDELRDLLERLAGHVQMNVRAVYDEPAVLREIVASEPDVARAREQTKGLGDAGYFANIELGEAVTLRLVERQRVDSERIAERLAPLAVDVAADAQEASTMLVLKASYLVERATVERFDSEVEAVAKAEAPTIRFELLGPLPPSAFVSLAGES